MPFDQRLIDHIPIIHRAPLAAGPSRLGASLQLPTLAPENLQEAVFENGVFRPLEPVTLEEHQEVMLSVGDEPDGNLADLATLFFGDQGVELPAHPAVPVRQAPDFGE